MDTVTVACKLPNGLHLENRGSDGTRQRVTLNGARLATDVNGMPIATHELAGAYGLTPNVPAKFWEQWVKENAGYGPYARGLVFAQADGANARAQARELAELKTGLEPLDPSKPAAGVTPADKN
jgi:hypothetical protein